MHFHLLMYLIIDDKPSNTDKRNGISGRNRWYSSVLKYLLQNLPISKRD